MCRKTQFFPVSIVNDIKETDEHIITDHKNDLDQILLHENGRYRYDTNRMILLLSTIKFCIDKKRFTLLCLVSNQLVFNPDKPPVVRVLLLYSLMFYCNFHFISI